MNIPNISAINSVGGVFAAQPNALSIVDAANLLRNPITGGLSAAEATAGQSFETFFEAYMDMVNSTARLEAQAQNLQVEYALGNHDDMVAVILAQEMAYTSLFFTVQVTNRIIQAYQEIMRMQI